jgi:hypothetical protein
MDNTFALRSKTAVWERKEEIPTLLCNFYLKNKNSEKNVSLNPAIC